jgi:hypothetical protein
MSAAPLVTDVPQLSSAINETQLVKTIKAHLAKAAKYQSKAEEHLITAGQYLMTLKGNSPDQATFLQIVQEQIGLGKSRTYELLQIADGRTTTEKVRADTAKRVMKHAKGCPLANGQSRAVTVVDEPEPADVVPAAEARRPDDVGPDSAGEVARLQARCSELEAINRRLEIKVAGLEARIVELTYEIPPFMDRTTAAH